MVSIVNIKEELLNFLRNADIISTTDRSVTTTTDEFDGDNIETVFTLTNSNAKNIRAVTVGGVAQSFGTDYTIDLDNAKVTFTVAPASGTDNVDIQYDYGNTDRIFPDFPDPYLKLNQFPRIAMELITGSSKDFAVGGGPIQSSYVLSIVCYDSDQDNVDAMIASIRSVMQANKKNFYYSPYLQIDVMSPIIPSPFGQNKIMQRSQDYRIEYICEG